jgi:hypothetical protein
MHCIVFVAMVDKGAQSLVLVDLPQAAVDPKHHKLTVVHATSLQPMHD